MENSPEKERDSIAWFRIGLLVTAAFVGTALYIFGARVLSDFFLGYALFSASMMLVFRTWRSSSEVDEAGKRHRNRRFRNIPRGVVRLSSGYVVFLLVLAAGIMPLLLVSNDLYHQHVRIVNAYLYCLVAASIFILFWAGGLFKVFRRLISDIKELRDAAKKAKERRAGENRDRKQPG